MVRHNTLIYWALLSLLLLTIFASPAFSANGEYIAENGTVSFGSDTWKYQRIRSANGGHYYKFWQPGAYGWNLMRADSLGFRRDEIPCSHGYGYPYWFARYETRGDGAQVLITQGRLFIKRDEGTHRFSGVLHTDLSGPEGRPISRADSCYGWKSGLFLASSKGHQDNPRCTINVDNMAGNDHFCDTFIEFLDPPNNQHKIIYIVNKDRPSSWRPPANWHHGRFNECEVLLRDTRQECKP